MLWNFGVVMQSRKKQSIDALDGKVLSPRLGFP